MEQDQPSYQLPEGSRPLTVTEQFNIMAAQLDYWKMAYNRLWTEQRDVPGLRRQLDVANEKLSRIESIIEGDFF